MKSLLNGMMIISAFIQGGGVGAWRPVLRHATTMISAAASPAAQAAAARMLAENTADQGVSFIEEEQWRQDAAEHRAQMDALLYPPGASQRGRRHAVAQNPLYNFLHRYYRYSSEEIMKYSPGMGCGLLGVQEADQYAVATRYAAFGHDRDQGKRFMWYNSSLLLDDLATNVTFRTYALTSNREILRRTASKPPYLNCYGLHEWAMLYSGAKSDASPLKRHQEQVPLRVPQAAIDALVEGGMLKCTHFDAWRFFHPAAQPMNMVNPMTRAAQKVLDQPGCVHATMDLFKFAYQLAPFTPSHLLRGALQLAFRARRIDIRGSPYDVSAFVDEGPICVETADGRRQYAAEQEALSIAAAPLRRELLELYERVLGPDIAEATQPR